MSCDNCKYASQQSRDPKLTARLKKYNDAICVRYTNYLKRPLMIPLKNVAGPVCGGRWFEEKEAQGELL